MKITILFDATEQDDKIEAEAEGQKVTLVSEQVKEILVSLGHEVRFLAARPDVRQLAAALTKDDSDLIFNLCESLGGVSQHEQHVAALLEAMSKRFTGAPAIGLTLAQDKSLSKKIFYFHGLPYPKFSTMNAGEVEWSDDLSFPLFVKPSNEDASIGIDSKAVVHNIKELMERISYIQTEFKTPALIEEYIEGREIYVGILGNEALPLLEWDFSKMPDGHPKFASSEAKWDEDSAYSEAPQIFPTDIPEAVVNRIQEAAVTAFKVLKLRDYGRVDLRLRRAESAKKITKKGASPELDAPFISVEGWEFYIIEANPNPYLDRKAEYAMASRKHGLKYAQLIERIIQLAMERTP
ncbi:D-alanine--D-alanine ligase [bacterium]|nr:D-alanine--D-alanine ligase [bacterium]